MFQGTRWEGFKPHGDSVSSVLSAVRDLENQKVGFEIHGNVTKQGLGQDKWVCGLLILFVICMESVLLRGTCWKCLMKWDGIDYCVMDPNDCWLLPKWESYRGVGPLEH